jgi:hypothetical protein
MKILLRVLALVAAAEAVAQLVMLGDDGSGGADIGAGLLAFAVLFLGAFAGGLLDGHRDPLRAAAMRWVAVAALVGVVETLLIPVRDGALDLSVLASDLAAVAPFLAVIVGSGAAVGVLIGGSVRNATIPDGRPTV